MFAVIWKSAVGTLTVLATVMVVGGVASAVQHL